MSTTGTDSVSTAPNQQTNSQPAAVTSVLLIPSLRGKLVIDPVSQVHICKGVWAMSDDSHNLPGQTSEFEFRLVKPLEGSNDIPFPKNGKYQGWFHLKQAPPLKPPVAKIEDKEMKMNFIKETNSNNYIIEGEGVNKFGSFSLKGSLNMSDNTVQIYRTYLLKPIKPKNLNSKSCCFFGKSVF